MLFESFTGNKIVGFENGNLEVVGNVKVMMQEIKEDIDDASNPPFIHNQAVILYTLLQEGKYVLVS